MYIIIRSWYPPSKADEVAKRHLEHIKKDPLDESLAKNCCTDRSKSH